MSSWLFGGEDPVDKQIVSLVTTIRTSQLHEDRLKALKQLFDVSGRHPLEVGLRGLSCIVDDVLYQHTSNSTEITKLCMDILMNLFMPPSNNKSNPSSDSSDSGSNSSGTNNNNIMVMNENGQYYYESNMELLLKPSNEVNKRMNIFIDLLSNEYQEEFEIRYNVIQVLTILLLYKNTQHKIQSELVNIYGAMNCFSELLKSGDASHASQNIYLRGPTIVLLTQLCENDESIQKTIAFNGAFERLLAIITEEDGILGGTMILDCLNLMDILLSHFTNRKYFVEIGCVEHLKTLLQLNDWTNESQLVILNKVLDILIKISDATSHLYNCQSSLGKLMNHIVQIVAVFGIQDSGEDRVSELELKGKCLLLLEMMLFGHIANQNQLLAMKVKVTNILDKTNNALVEYALLFLTRLALGHNYGSKGMETSIHTNTKYNISLQCTNVLESLFFKNRQIQQVAMQHFLKAQLTNNTGVMNDKSLFGDFGRLLLQTVSIYNATKKGFGDALKFWYALKIVVAIINDNNDCKALSLAQKMSIIDFDANENKTRLVQTKFEDVIFECLICTIDKLVNFDERVQIGLLSVIISLCYESRKCINALFTQNRNGLQYLQKILTLIKSTNSVPSLGLATYLIAVMLEFARDVKFSGNNGNELVLFDVITREIGLNQFKQNLGALRESHEYKSLLSILADFNGKHGKAKRNSLNGVNGEENSEKITLELVKKRRVLSRDKIVSIIFESRFKVLLYDLHFVENFESIIGCIDSRMVQLMTEHNSNNNRTNNINNNNNNNINNNRLSNNSNRMGMNGNVGNNHNTNNNMNSNANNIIINNNNNNNNSNNSSSNEKKANEVKRITQVKVLKMMSEEDRQKMERMEKEIVALKEQLEREKTGNTQLTKQLEQAKEREETLQRIQREQQLQQQKQQQQQQREEKRRSGSNVEAKEMTAMKNRLDSALNELNGMKVQYDKLSEEHQDLLVYLGHVLEQHKLI